MTYEHQAQRIMHDAYSKWQENGSALPLDQFLAKEINLAGLLEQLDTVTTHTCHDNCPRLECSQRREIEELVWKLAEIRRLTGA